MSDSAENKSVVAIVGMAAVFPGARDLDTYWSNLVNGVDAITEVPKGRWGDSFFDPGGTGPDRFYCKRGGFVDGLVTFDPTRFSMMPSSVEGTEPDQLIALATASAALEDAGGLDALADNERAGIVLGRGGYIGAGQARLDLRTRVAGQLVHTLGDLLPDLTATELDAVRAEFQKRLGPLRPEDAIGLVPNLVASRVANRLDLRGPAFTVDAACASSLVAIDHAVRELADRRCDVMIAGGVHHCHDLTLWSVFTQLGAISRNGTIRPFDRGADGLLIGEGTGVVVLKRLEDAERAGDRIYAVVRGVGIASDGRATTLMRPSQLGQVLAIRRAWEAAEKDPASVGLIEAHGTATPTGDEEELESLATAFGPPGGQSARVPLGSVKSMIGHAMPAAGIAGVIKAALALHHRVVPPTLHCEEPLDALEKTRFRPASQAEEWSQSDAPRRAGVNAFGFGGVNAHAVLEEHGADRRAVARARYGPKIPQVEVKGGEDERVVLCAADDLNELLAQFDRQAAGGAPDPAEWGSGGSLRVAVVAPTPKRLAFARNVVVRGRPWLGRLDIWYTPRPLLPEGRTAFLFPGLEAEFAPQVESLAAQLGVSAPKLAGPEEVGQQGIAILGLGRMLVRALDQLGVRADMVAGHSIGEWNGMLAAGMVPPEAEDPYMATLDPGSLQMPDVVFAAVGCGGEQAQATIDGLADVVVSHDNCPHQSIVCGSEAAIEEAKARFKQQRLVCEVLPFRSGFHSPMFEPYLDVVREGLARMPLQAARVPLWSATTCAPYPDDADSVRDLALRHLVKPVRFRAMIESLYEAGARVFLQMGVGSLVGFVDDTLRGRDFLVVAAASDKRDGHAQLRRLAAAIWVEGGAIDPLSSLLFSERASDRGKATSSRERPIELGTPLVSLEGVALRKRPEARGAGAPPSAPLQSSPAVAHGAHANQAEDAQTGHGSSEGRTVVSVERMPWLADHCLSRQPATWPSLADRFPVVPLTTMVSWMGRLAASASPQQSVVGMEGVRAQRWLVAAPPCTVATSVTRRGPDRRRTVIEGYAQATVVMGEHAREAPEPAFAPTAGEEPSLISAAALYSDRWMFHGPSFQSVCEVASIGPGGLRGSIRALHAPGSLLDGAGQLVGYWVMARARHDRIVLPTGIDHIEFFGPEPPPGSVVECAIRIVSVDQSSVKADLELVHEGRVWARIAGWTERRFETDEQIWAVHRFPEYHLLSEPRPGGWLLTRERWKRTASRDLIARHYLTEAERAEYDAHNPLAQRQWLLGRIAVKDAVRHWLWSQGAGAVFPAEIGVRNDSQGAPIVFGPFEAPLRVSLAHRGPLAVAAVRNAVPIGIDVEAVAPRGEGFGRVAMTPAERELMAPQGDRGLARAWVAKEAAAKHTGNGLQGDPKRFEVTGIDPPALIVGDVRVETEAITEGGSEFVVGWTAH